MTIKFTQYEEAKKKLLCLVLRSRENNTLLLVLHLKTFGRHNIYLNGV